ncbi:hypothetical protein Lser_V15G26857 [Lactuca serriola]
MCKVECYKAKRFLWEELSTFIYTEAKGSNNHHHFRPPKPDCKYTKVEFFSFFLFFSLHSKGDVAVSYENLIAKVAVGSLEINFYPLDVSY